MSHTKEQLDRYFKSKGGYRTKKEREEFWTEDKMQSEVVDYLTTNHPNVFFFSDMSGAHLSKKQASKFASLRNIKVPDMFLFCEGRPDLILELKKLGERVVRKDGKVVASQHIKNQANSLLFFRSLGKIADFSVGYEQTIAKINAWVEGKKFDYLLEV